PPSPKSHENVSGSLSLSLAVAEKPIDALDNNTRFGDATTLATVGAWLRFKTATVATAAAPAIPTYTHFLFDPPPDGVAVTCVADTESTDLTAVSATRSA